MVYFLVVNICFSYKYWPLNFVFIFLYWLLKPTCILQSPYGDGVEPEKAPEAISKAVASLPPEQMFELMKQMKVYMIKVEGLTI